MIPLKELRLRFCDEPAKTEALGNVTSRKLQVLADPWFISMDGQQEVRVNDGAWSLVPLGDPTDASGAHFLRFYLDLPNGVYKSSGDAVVGLHPGRRLFFGLTFWETDELPRIRKDTRSLQAVIHDYEESLRPEGRNMFQRVWSSVKGYNTYKDSRKKLEKMNAIGSPPKAEGVYAGPYTAAKEGYVGVQGGPKGTQFGQVGTFAIKRVGEPTSEPTVYRRAILDDSQRSAEATALRIVLYNDPFNKRARVASVLKSVAGLTEEEANQSMMAAHTQGRGLVKVFAAEGEDGTLTDAQREEAAAMVAKLGTEGIFVDLELVPAARVAPAAAAARELMKSD
jgi:ATP-dependent Clp protease adapter protein ClpS